MPFFFSFYFFQTKPKTKKQKQNKIATLPIQEDQKNFAKKIKKNKGKMKYSRGVKKVRSYFSPHEVHFLFFKTKIKSIFLFLEIAAISVYILICFVILLREKKREKKIAGEILS